MALSKLNSDAGLENPPNQAYLANMGVNMEHGRNDGQ